MKHLIATLIALNCFLTHSQVDWDLRFSDDVMNIAFGDEYDFLTTRTSVFRSNAGMNEWTECNWTLGIVRDGTSVLNGLSWNNERLVVAALDNGYFMSEDLGESFVQTGPTGFGTGSESILHSDEGELVATMGGFQRGLWKCGQSPSTNWSNNYSVGADQRDIQQVGEHLFAVSHSPNHPGGILQSSDFGGSWQLVFGTQYSGNPSSYVILENTLIFISWDGVVHHIDMTNWSELTSFSSAIVSPSDMLEVEGALFLASYDGGVYRSEDLGQTWEDIGPNNSSFYRLVLHGDDLFAAGETGLWSVHAPGPSGCTDPMSCNYNAEAEEDDGSCLPYDALAGCVDETACNFNINALCSDESCVYPLIAGDCESGSIACAEGTNWNATLQQCVPIESSAPCGEGTYWDDGSQTCVIDSAQFWCLSLPIDNSCYFDVNGNGVVGPEDLLSFLASFASTCEATVVETPWACGDPLEYQGYDYATVLIGEQCWFAENLRNENYENGDAIPSNLSDSEWSSTTSGAVAVYGEGSSSCDNFSPDGDACDEAWSLNEYGRLYNYYAVEDGRRLCPSGWHVPTDGEWMTMEMALGMSESEANDTGYRGADQGSQMKTDFGWSDGGNGTNSSGFSGLPGGYRNDLGYFDDAGVFGFWWSSSPEGISAWFRLLSVNYEGVYRSGQNRRSGFSVRCVQDAE